jgi:hypothetical protein
VTVIPITATEQYVTRAELKGIALLLRAMAKANQNGVFLPEILVIIDGNGETLGCLKWIEDSWAYVPDMTGEGGA